MAVIHRALVTWFLVFLFLIFLIFKLDGRFEWNWFVVFTPMWIFDLKLATFLMVKIFQNSRRRNGPIENISVLLRKRFVYLASVIFKLVFQSLLCLKLQYYSSLSIYIVMTPFWGLMITLNCILIDTLMRPRDPSYHSN